MSESPLLPYVLASAALLELPLDAARARRVAAHLERTAALARLLEQVALEPDDEPAELYRPTLPLAAGGAG